MKKVQRNAFNFKLNPIAASIVLAMSSQFVTSSAIAGSGWGAGIYSNAPAVTTPVQTYYANSPAGSVNALDPVTGLPSLDPVTNLPVKVDTGKALRKFVDTLPGIPGITTFTGTMATVNGTKVVYNPTSQANDLGQYIPVAVPEKWVDTNGNVTNDDYYEIAAVEYSEQLHADLSKPTRLRGYVQISTPTNPGKHIPLTYPNGAPILDINGAQVFAVDAPQHLGPIINAASGTAVRVKFDNYLPYSTKAQPNAGDLWLPVDKTLAGAGLGPDGVSYYTENRAEIRLVGGETPWVSGGSPHQWVTPRLDYNANVSKLFKGVSVQNVPDMATPEKGSVTLYFPNQQSSRFTFYEDRTSGMTRLNVYAGLAAGYFVTDPTEASLVASGAIPKDQIPLILEDKTFVPDDIAQQDAKWDTTHWGQPGDLWFPHVYETNQDPNSVDGTNPVGRWDYGPWFWPIFPAPAALPSGGYGSASFVPEAYQDTPLVNGTAYPTVTLDPKAYRFRILNASDDRYYNLGLYLADTTVKAPELDRNGNPVFNNSNGAQSFYSNTEIKMVPAVADASGAPLVPSSPSGLPQYDPNCLCQYPGLPQLQDANQFSGPNRAWPVDNRLGGAPDPASVGPDFIAIGTGGGFLPNPVDIPSQPVTYESNRRSITIGNIYGYGLLLGPQERTDAIVDFSAYKGKTLILYNDAPAPVPFIDQRVDYYTGDPDQTMTGGTYSTLPGYGPNTRTIMQIVIRNTKAAPAFNAGGLLTALPAAYGASQPAPIVPESGYNAAFGTSDTDNYAHVATSSVAQPNLDFTPSAANLVMDRVDVITSGGTIIVGTTNLAGNANPGSGSGYDPLNPPTVVFNNGNCLPASGTSAAATATVDSSSHQVTAVTLTNPGSGYTCAPVITFQSVNGIGAQAVAHFATTQSIMVQPKTEQELFDNAGRYNSTGGEELNYINANTQTTIPLSYIDTPTDIIRDGETQIWKIVDNGLWTNSMHFDGYDVQLINRVGWDGTVKVPAMNELGWKDTLRLNPLEDVIVAMRAHNPKVPFGQPASSRLQDPSLAAGAVPDPAHTSSLTFLTDPGVVSPTVSTITVNNGGTGYTKNPIITFVPQPGDAGSGATAKATVTAGVITAITVTNPGGGYTAAPNVVINDTKGVGAKATAVVGAPLLTTTTNVIADYDNEFTWGSALLSHAEDDFTRPTVFHPTVTAVPAASAPVLTIAGVNLSWTDPTPAATSLGNPMNEISFQVQEQIVDAATGAVTQAWKLVATLPANTTKWTAPAAPAAGTLVYFRVRARNLAGGAWSIVQQML